MNDAFFDYDVLDYFPIKDGLKPSSIGLRKIPNQAGEDKKNNIFQFDEFFDCYRTNKLACRKERLSKYYQTKESAPKQVLEYIVNKLIKEHSDLFSFILSNDEITLKCEHTKEELSFDLNFRLNEERCVYDRNLLYEKYVDAWDALSMQVAEDLALQKVPENKQDYTQILHLCHANGWSAEGAIGQSFDKLHEDVPGISKIIPNSKKILEAILNSDQSMERVGAMQYRTSGELNRHPSLSREELNTDFDPVHNPHVYLRFERQTVTSFKAQRCFLFTIRTYLTHMNQKGRQDWKWEAFKNTLHEDKSEVKSYSFIQKYKKPLLDWVDVVEGSF